MRVGIVGGGGAGLAAAWLLEEAHEVTLLEAERRLGGHAMTVEVPSAAGPVAVDLGPEFLSTELHATVLRLMRLAGVSTVDLRLTLTLYDTRRPGATLLPPFRRGRLSLRPRDVPDLIRLQRVLRRAPAAVDLEGGPFTVDELLDAAGARHAFRWRLFHPLALAGWCVDLDDFRAFSAHNVLRYMVAAGGSAFRAPRWLAVRGGMGAYVAAVAAQLRRAAVRVGTPVATIARGSAGLRLHPADGGAPPQEVDAVILATNALQARALLRDLAGAQPLRRALEGFRYGQTHIAVHGDPRLMPPDSRDWSTANVRFDGRHSQSTMWTAGRGVRVFKSWITYERRLPDRLYAEATFAHGMIDRGYFAAQRALGELQGRDGIWLAGVYTAGIDSHESAIRSAIRIAGRLAPEPPRLRALTG